MRLCADPQVLVAREKFPEHRVVLSVVVALSLFVACGVRKVKHSICVVRHDGAVEKVELPAEDEAIRFSRDVVDHHTCEWCMCSAQRGGPRAALEVSVD